MATIQISVLHPAGAAVTYHIDAPASASVQQMMAQADNAIATLAANGYRFDEADAETLEEGEKRDTATSYVTGETSNGDRCIWGYHFPRDKKTVVIYPEQFHLWPFEIDWSKPWPSSTAPTYAEAKRKGYLHDLPETAEFVRRPTGKLWEGKPETKFNRMIRPLAIAKDAPAAAPAQPPTNGAAPAVQPPPASEPTRRVPTAEDLAKAQPPPAGMNGFPAQDQALRDEFTGSVRLLFGVEGEELEKRIAWCCRIHSGKKYGADRATSDINMMTDDDLRHMLAPIQNNGPKVLAAWAKYLEIMTPTP